MSLGDYLYSITGMESVSQPLHQRRINQAAGVAAAAVTITVDLPPVPLGKVELLSHITMRGFAGAAQTCTAFQAHIVNELNQFLAPLGRVRPVAPVQFDDVNLEVDDVVLMPNEHVRIFATFSAGGVANNADVTTIGLLIPQGNIQRG